MQEFAWPVAGAFWIGILTAISPCPLATNIAAVSFVSYRIENKLILLASGLLYTIGRSLTYIVISFLVVEALVNVPLLSDFLQRHINKVLGIVLILVGMVLLELIPLPVPRFAPSEKTQTRLDRAGVVGSFLLGALFALAFCPVSAALFFGSLIPLAIKSESSFGLPLVYGVGTALPVLAFAVLVAAGSSLVDKFYHGVAKLGSFTKKLTGAILIGIGIYYVLRYVFEVF
jgi:cytochrome c biogenesis protein CcdA